MEKIIAIHSVPRSGSSWLYSIFNSHQNTICSYQPLFSYAFKNRVNASSSKNDFSDFFQDIYESSDPFCNMTSNFHSNNNSSPLPDTIQKNNPTHLVFKHVTHHTILHPLLDYFPNFHLVALERDLQDAINSQCNATRENLKDWKYGTDKNTSDELYFGVHKWLEVNKLFHHLHSLYSDRVHLVKYETLKQSPHDITNNLFNVCHLSPSTTVNSFISKSIATNDTYDYSVFRNHSQMKQTYNFELDSYIHSLK
jgi:hypothetical protein